MENDKKTALAVWHSGGKGKTESIRQFAIELLSIYPKHLAIIPNPATVPPVHDFRLVVEINGQIIGVESQGDPKTGLKKRLEQLAKNHNCNLIICSCRTRGETVEAVSNLRSLGFEIIWTSTYELDNITERGIANNTKGKHILNLLQTLKKI